MKVFKIIDISKNGQRTCLHPYAIKCDMNDVEAIEIVAWCYETVGNSMTKLKLQMYTEYPNFEKYLTSPEESTWVFRHDWSKLRRHGNVQEFFFKNYTDALMFKLRWASE